MQRIAFCTFVVCLLFLSTGLSAGARPEARSTLDSALLLSTSPASTPLPVVGTPGIQAPSILSPLPGQALQGNVPIIARTDLEGFVSAELSFSYFKNPTGVWFLIQRSSQPVMFEALTHWDTTTITDGVYSLRLIIYLSDGNQQTLMVPGVRVRNYTPIETDAASPDALTKTSIYSRELIETKSPALTPNPSIVTPFPPNPAVINQQGVINGILKGALFTLGMFALGILYHSIRTFFKNRSN